jgi:hypothetical protein
MINTSLILIMLVMLVNMSCSQNRTYLTDQEKAWNAYREGQVLVFGTTDGRIDTVTVNEVQDRRFPDGLGAETNERLRVLATVNSGFGSEKRIEVRFLYILAKTGNDPSKIDFELSIGNGAFLAKAFPVHELDEYKENFLETPYGAFNDVIRIDDNSGRILKDNDIKTIFWSKSVGYVKCEKKDGSTWELLKIIDNP